MRFSLRSRVGLFLVLLLLLASGLGLLTSSKEVAKAAHSPLLWLSQKVGPPTASVQLTGGGFGQSETVNVDFDATHIATTATDTTGKFVVRITVPKTALPGTHTLQATGQSSGFTASVSFLVQTDWAQFHFGPQHTGYNPYENVLSSSNVSALTLDWSYATGNAIAFSSPAVANGLIYVGSLDDTLYALDAVTGALKWSYKMGGYIDSSPAVTNGVVYVGSGDYKLYALDALTGTLKWSYTTGSYLTSSPAVANGMVYVGSQDGKLYALDAVTGSLKWRYSTGKHIYSSPAVANGLVFVCSGYGKLYALDAMTGALKWSFRPGSLIDYSSPTVADGFIYIGTSDAKLYALNGATGTLKWSYSAVGSYSSPAVANGLVFVGSDKLYALDAMTGALKWSYATGSSTDFIDSSPAVANGVVYVGSQDWRLYAFHLPSMS
jgi:outer membrane protein assembly factor BamB